MAADAEQKIERRTCWINESLHQMAKEIASREGLSIPEVMERDLTAPLTRRYRRMFPDAEVDLGGEAGGA